MAQAPRPISNGNVAFNDDASVASIGLSTTVSPSSMVFNNSAIDYTIGGSGTINGSGPLTLNGTHTVTLNTINGFTGGRLSTVERWF